MRRILDETGLYGRVARKKPLLTERHKRIRLTWAKERKDWTVQEWYPLFGQTSPNLTYLETIKRL